MIEFKLKERDKRPPGIKLRDFAAFSLYSKYSEQHLKTLLQMLGKQDLDSQYSTKVLWKHSIRTFEPTYEGHIRRITSQHYHLDYPTAAGDRMFTRTTEKRMMSPLLTVIPPDMFLVNRSHTRRTGILTDVCFDEMNFWLKVFQGFHFAKDHARGWWWIAIVPNHRTGFASKIGGYEDRSYPERDKREVTFVFQDETDAILTSSYMDTIEPITVTL